MYCQKCLSPNVSIERRPDGDCICRDCGHKWKNGSDACDQRIAALEAQLAASESERNEARAKLEAVLNKFGAGDMWNWHDEHRQRVRSEIFDLLDGKPLSLKDHLDLLKGRDECLAVVEGLVKDEMFSQQTALYGDQLAVWRGSKCIHPGWSPVTVPVLRRDNEGGEG